MPASSSLLSTLNPEQLQAVTYQNGPLLIIAGAGTGKTTVIAYKIAWLIEQKLAGPSEILALTFTDKAANELEERVDKLLPYGVFDTWISTFHSFSQRILENYGLDIGISPDYRLLNATESWLLMRKNLYKFNLDYYRPRGNPAKFIQALLKLFSRLKDENIAPLDYLKYADNLLAKTDTAMSDESAASEARRIKETADGFFQYQQIMSDNNFLDFGDLIYYANKLFLERSNILQKYQKQFKYILVDEFQDTNLAQYQLIKLLTTPENIRRAVADNGSAGKLGRESFRGNLTVVGDDDQAIYKFRGASVSNILNFKKDFPQSREIVLTKNYRSSQNILDTAYQFIQNNNPDRLEYQLNHPDKYYQGQVEIKIDKISKKLQSQTKTAGQIEFIPAADLNQEISLVINKIKNLLIEAETAYSDIAILARANKSVEPFSQALDREKLPYIYFASSGLYKQDIIIDILSYARVLFDRADSISLSRILKIPGLNISDDDLLKINYWASRQARSLRQTLENIRLLPDLAEETITKIESLLSAIKENTKLAHQQGSLEMFFKILADTNYRQHLLALEQVNPTQATQYANFLNQLIRKIEKYRDLYDDKTLKGFIAHVDLEREAGDSGSMDQDILEQGPEAIKVLTIHSAKGLEFKYVFIVNLVQQKFPTISRSDLITIPDDLIKTREILSEGDEHLQEERRLFYVALTRAKQGLYLTAALNYGGKRNVKPSQFLIEAEILKNKQEFLTKNLISQYPNTPISNNKTQVSSFKFQVPKEFSFSQIAAFRKCPLQYKYQFILKIPQDKGKPSFSFGRTMHNTLLAIFKQVKLRADNSQTSLFSSIDTSLNPSSKDWQPETSPDTYLAMGGKENPITLDEIYQIYQQNWLDDWYEDAESKEHYFKAGRKILKEFFEQHQNNWPIPLYLEMPFRVSLGQYIIKGRIDRIDKIDDNKGIEIIDYKTGSYKDQLYGDDKMQLLIYQIALENNASSPQKLTYYFLDDKKQGAVSFIGSQAEIKKIKQELIDIIEQIQHSYFPAALNEFTCKFCDFKNICAESAI